MPSPSIKGFLARKQHGQYSDKEVSVLINLRIHAHALATVTGAHYSPVVPLDERICPHCRGERKVEDEAHFLLECPQYQSEREEMLSKLADVYPSFKAQWGTMNRTQRLRRLLWSIPDGTAPLWPVRGQLRADARVLATRAILNYLGAAAKKHPQMKDQLYNKAPGA